MPIRCFDTKDQEIANEMFDNLKYLLDKYKWLEVYEYAWRTMANKMTIVRLLLRHKLRQAREKINNILFIICVAWLRPVPVCEFSSLDIRQQVK